METRPDRPNPELLDQARTTLAEQRSIDASKLAWVVGDRMVRKRSTLFHLTLGDVATAYYKAPYYPEDQQDSRHLTRARDALHRGRLLSDRFAELAAGSGVEVNVTLASDPDTLETVTLGLEGEPMGNPLRLAASRRQEAMDTCHRVGAAVTILETMDDPDPGPPEAVMESAGRKLESAAGHLSDDEIFRLAETLRELFTAAMEEGGVVLTHGDLSPGNLILMEEATGLIDFLWISQLRGFDLSRFVYRLRNTPLSYRPWTDRLVAAAMEGYGDPEAIGRPGWRFSEIMHMLTTLQRLDRRGQTSRAPGKRAIAGLKAVLAGYSDIGRNRT